MCYPKPGPRCSKHAYEKVLKSALKLEKLNKSVSKEERKAEKKHGRAYTDSLSEIVDKKNKQQKEYDSAVEEYLSTPRGIKALKEKFGDHKIVEKYEQRRKAQLEDLRAENPAYAKGQEEVETNSGNALGEIVRKHVVNHETSVLEADKQQEKEQWIRNLPVIEHPRSVVGNMDMRAVYDNSDKIESMSMGDTLYVNHEGDCVEDPGKHAYRSRLTLVSGSEATKTLKVEYNPEYYAKAATDKDLKAGRKKSYSTLKSAKEMSERIQKGGDNVDMVMVNVSGNEHRSSITSKGTYAPVVPGGYVDGFYFDKSKRNQYDNPEAYDDLHAKQQDIMATNKKLKSLEQKKTEFSQKHRDGGRAPDPETMKLFNTRIEEGYTKLSHQITLYNNVNKLYKDQNTSLAEQKRQDKNILESEKAKEDTLETFHELKSLNFS